MTKTPHKRKRGRPPGSLNKPRETPAERLGFRVDEFAKLHGISRNAVYTGIRKGNIKSKLIGGCRIILP
jgi:hypothetical protein